MKNLKFLLSLLIVLSASLIAGAVGGTAVGAGVFGAAMFAKGSGVMPMAVTPEIWTDYIAENLFKNNEFILQSIDESQYVIGTGVVHIPQAGSPSGVQRNRSQLPATITRRGDIDVTYVLDEFTTDPRFITNADKAELSYDKMDSCMSEDMSYLQQFVAEAMAYNWRPTWFLKTTGDSTDATIGTGNRKAITVADFVSAKKQFNKWNIPEADRNVLISTDMLGQIVNELKANSNRDYSVIYDPISGKIKKLESFTIYERSTGLVASKATITQNSSTKLWTWTSTDLIYTPEQMQERWAEEAAFATTSAEIALFYSKFQVSRALGKTEMFDDQGNPTYYGDIYSFLQRAGGRKRRADAKGVLGVIQETV